MTEDIEHEEFKTIILPRSPSLTKRVLEHKIDMEEKAQECKFVMQEKEEENTWRSFCLVCNKNAVMYFTQVGIMIGVMGFSVYKLSSDDSPQAQQIYIGLLTMMIGLAFPQPVFK